MKDERKTKKQLISELVEVRQRVAELESLEVERKQAEESQREALAEALRATNALRESEERFRTVSELISDFVYAIRVEPDGTMAYEWTTEALTHVTGFTVQELEKRGGLVSLVHPDDRRGTLRRLRTLRSDQSSTTDELRVFTKSGERIGSVYDLLPIAENDVLVVRGEDHEFLIPLTPTICLDINIGNRTITIDPPEGLLDLNEI